MNEMRINRFSEEGVMKRGLTVVLAALVLLTGCELRYRAISKLDITDAESLYLVPEAEAEARGTGNVMFKITKEGAVVEVSYTSNSGIKASAKSLKPDAIYHANDEYMIVVFRYSIACLVSKKTGAVYSLENVGAPCDYQLMFVNSSPVLSDGKNNIYFRTSKYNPDNPDKYEELYRIDVTNPEKVTAKPLTAPNDKEVFSFAVDAAGNVVYSYYGNNSGGARLALAGGGFANCDNTSYWTAPDGNLYYQGDQVYDETTGEYGCPIYRLDIEGQKVTETEYGRFNVYIGSDSYYLTSGDRAYILNSYGELIEVYNPEGKPHLVEGVPALTNIQAVTQSEEELFIAGKNDKKSCVIRVNPMTGAWSDLYTPGDYEVYNMVYAGGRLTVNALRMNDGAIIMGELDEAGKMNVLDEKSNSKVLYLTRIK